jgi:hypothetical protein
MPTLPTPPSTAPPGHGPERLETVVHYRPYSLITRILFTALFAALSLGFLAGAFFASRDVTIDCSHQTSLCVVTRAYPLLGARRESIDLASINGTRMRGRTTKNGSLTYAVFLSTTGGDRAISFQYAPRGRQGQKRALDAFLANPDAPPLHLLYDQGNPLGFLFCLAPLIWLWVLWTLWQQARVRFEWWRRAVVLERFRWPLPLWSRAFQVEEIAGAQVDRRGYPGRRTYRVDLLLGSGESVPLLTIRAGFAGPSEAAAAEISAAVLNPR